MANSNLTYEEFYNKTIFKTNIGSISDNAKLKQVLQNTLTSFIIVVSNIVSNIDKNKFKNFLVQSAKMYPNVMFIYYDLKNDDTTYSLLNNNEILQLPYVICTRKNIDKINDNDKKKISFYKIADAQEINTTTLKIILNELSFRFSKENQTYINDMNHKMNINEHNDNIEILNTYFMYDFVELSKNIK